MTVLVVGSVAFDTLKTPFGAVDRILGGAATHFSLASSLVSKPAFSREILFLQVKPICKIW